MAAAPHVHLQIPLHLHQTLPSLHLHQILHLHYHLQEQQLYTLTTTSHIANDSKHACITAAKIILYTIGFLHPSNVSMQQLLVYHFKLLLRFAYLQCPTAPLSLPSVRCVPPVPHLLPLPQLYWPRSFLCS